MHLQDFSKICVRYFFDYYFCKFKQKFMVETTRKPYFEKKAKNLNLY